MENKIKNFSKYLLENDKNKLKIITVIGVIGILLLSLPEIIPKHNAESNSDNNEIVNYCDYIDNLESKLTNIIESIDGAGECRVMITLENTSENIYATDSELKIDDDSKSNKDNYVIYNAQSGESPVLINTNMPKIQGVTIVCSGGDNVKVREVIIKTVTSLFDISTNRVSVSKIKQ